MSVALGLADPEDSPRCHADDTLAAGRRLNDQELVEALADEAPARVADLEEYGALFDRTAAGGLVQRRGPGGGHSRPRALLAGDYIGFSMMIGLLRRTHALGIQCVGDVRVIQLTMERGCCVGAWILDHRCGGLQWVSTRAVVLAAGGAGQVYANTTNALESTGDGYALALEAGAVLRDMEQVQFHPTTMVSAGSRRGMLVTESVRGYGGRLYNCRGERFMRRYSPDRLELAYRDVVARAIATEIHEGRGVEGGVRLDVTHLDRDFIKARLPNMWRQFKRHLDVDIAVEPMIVSPACHHFMGGVEVDPVSCAATRVEGIYCCGEVMGGVHGANRLGGNSLAETQVFGRRAGTAAAAFEAASTASTTSHSDQAPALPHLRDSVAFLAEERRQLREEMWRDAGLFRSEDGLRAARLHVEGAMSRIEGLQSGPDPVVVAPFESSVEMWLDLKCMLCTASAVIVAALARQESRGAHFRSDYPAELSDSPVSVRVDRGMGERGGVALV
jgi:fumarate reductase (CoM/CoB) subunit A